MKKIRAFVAVCVAFTLLLSGCGSNLQKIRSRIRDIRDQATGSQEASGKESDNASIRPGGNRAYIGEEPMGEDGTWTILVYLCGTDLESGKPGMPRSGGNATNDLKEMITASREKNLRFIVQTGGTEKWKNDLMKPGELGRYEIADGKITTVGEPPSASMGSTDTLADFLTWGIEEYPAEKMALVLWDHGGGSITGVCLDEVYGGDTLTLLELNSALWEASAVMTDKFEFVGFDACFMATVETANVLSPYARYLYASEETEPGTGWDYVAIGEYIGSNPDADGAELGETMCNSYYAHCSDSEKPSATFSIIDLSKIDGVIAAFDEFSGNLYEITTKNEVFSIFVRNILNVADNFGSQNKRNGYTNMFDLGGLVNSAIDVDGAEEVLAAIDEAVVWRINGDWHENATGIATYYPLQLQGSDELKKFSVLAVSPNYLSLVARMVYGNANKGVTKGYDNSEIVSLWNDEELDYQAYDGYWDSYGSCEPTGNSPLIEYYDQPQVLSDGTFGFSLTDESLAATAGVQAYIYMVEGDDLIEYGVSVDINSDWENGIFTDNFDGYWFSLPDGQNLAVYVVDENREEGYDIYTAPVLLNGYETNLRFIYEYASNRAWIDCAWDGIDEYGMASRDFYELQQGDVITPIYYASPLDSDEEFYYYGNEYKYDGDPEIYFDRLYDGEYLYAFAIDDIYGDYVLTQFVNFTVDGKNIYFQEIN